MTLKHLIHIVLIALTLTSIIPYTVISNTSVEEPLLILSPSTWTIIGHINTSNMTITVIAGGAGIRITIPNISFTEWEALQGSFIDRTLAYVSNGDIRFVPEAFNYRGFLDDVLRNIVSTSTFSHVRVLNKYLELEPNSSTVISLWNRSLELISKEGSTGIILELSIDNYTGSIDSILAIIGYDDVNVFQGLPVPLGPSPIQTPVMLSMLLLHGIKEINSLRLKITSREGFKGILSIVFYAVKYISPYVSIKTSSGDTLQCRVYVELSPPLHIVALSNALKAYTDSLVNEIPLPAPNIDVGDTLVFSYNYSVSIEPYNTSLIEQWNMTYLLKNLELIFNSTRVSYDWATKLSLKVINTRSIDLDYAIRIGYFDVDYRPSPVKGGVPVCGDGFLGLCMVSYMNSLSGGLLTITLLQPGFSYTGKALWTRFPWGVDVGSSGYTPSLQDVVYNPISITQLYLGYPFSGLTPTLTALWFTGKGSVYNRGFGYLGNIPLVYLDFHGENYNGSIVVDTYYVIPLKAYFNGISPSWKMVGYNYKASYSLALIDRKGFWRNIKSYTVPVQITLSNGVEYKGFIIISQPELEKPSISYNSTESYIEIHVNPYYPVRILVLGDPSLIKGVGELFTLSLIGSAKILAPTRLISLPDRYGELLVFHMYNPVNGTVKLVLASGRSWLIRSIQIGEPIYLGNTSLNLQLPLTEKETSKSSTSSVAGEASPSSDRKIAYMVAVGLIVLLVVLAGISWWKKKS